MSPRAICVSKPVQDRQHRRHSNRRAEPCRSGRQCSRTCRLRSLARGLQDRRLPLQPRHWRCARAFRRQPPHWRPHSAKDQEPRPADRLECAGAPMLQKGQAGQASSPTRWKRRAQTLQNRLPSSTRSLTLAPLGNFSRTRARESKISLRLRAGFGVIPSKRARSLPTSVALRAPSVSGEQKAKPDISLAIKSGHFNLLRT